MKPDTLAHNLFNVSLLLFVLLFCLAPTGYAAEPPDNQAEEAYKKFVGEAGTPPEITWDENTGVPSFIRGTFPADLGTQRQAGGPALAYAFFDRYQDLFHMHSPTTELSLLNTRTEAAETHLHFQQMYRNVPVWGAQILVHSRQGQITAVNGHYQPDLNLEPAPVLTSAQAEVIARRELNNAPARLEEEVTLVVMTYHTPPTLTWLVQLRSENPLGRWRYFIDAHTGEITYFYNELPGIRNRIIYDIEGQCFLSGNQVANEVTGNSLSPGAARHAFDYTGNAYDYFFSTFGRDSYDNQGATITSMVDFGSVDFCQSYAWNAFWDGEQFVFGSGGNGVSYFSRAQDVVAHEYTHAVTEHTANLIYQFEQGALNESISDIFGAFAQQWATGNTSDWVMGEDLGFSLFFRDLSDPTLYNQPAHMGEFKELGWSTDNGGVHINSGIPNKAAYLMVTGGTFHDISVVGLGRSKTEQVFYRALTDYLSPLSGFNDIRNATIQACYDLVSSTFEINPPDCLQVQNTWTAVGIGAPIMPGLPLRTYLPFIVSAETNSGELPQSIYEPNDDVSQAYGPWLPLLLIGPTFKVTAM